MIEEQNKVKKPKDASEGLIVDCEGSINQFYSLGQGKTSGILQGHLLVSGCWCPLCCECCTGGEALIEVHYLHPLWV